MIMIDCARWEGSTRAKENHKSDKLDIIKINMMGNNAFDILK